MNTVTTLTHGAVNTAASLVRRPIGVAAHAVGLVKGTAEAGIDLVMRRRGEIIDRAATAAATAADRTADRVATAAEQDTDAPVPSQRDRQIKADEAKAAAGADEADAHEPQIVPKPVPTIDELPEPIVIHADDSTGESFHTEPKAASRDSEHGDTAGDREEASGYVEEIPAAEDEAEVVWTSESTPESTQPPADGASGTRA